MKTGFFGGASVAFVLLAILFLGPVTAKAAEFSADVNQTANGRSIPGKLYVKDKQMRLETMGTATIVDMNKGKSWVIMSGVNAYLEMGGVGALGRGAMDEEQIAEIGERKLVGKETVNGYECEKYLVEFKDRSLGTVTQWVSTKLDYPVKFISTGGAMEAAFELTNIEESEVDPSLFVIPSGYQKMEMPNMNNMKGMTQGGQSR